MRAATLERRTRGNGQVAPNPSGFPIPRRWSRVAAGVGLLVVFVWATVALVRSAGDRTEVVVVSHDVERLDRIGRSDLKVSSLGIEPGVATIPGGELDDLVGRVAATDLVAGAVLAPDQIVPEGRRLVGAGEAIVGARLKPAEVPHDGVQSGSDVLVVVRPAQGSTAAGEVSQVDGWVLSLGHADASTGERSASLVVPSSSAGSVAAAAAEGRVSLAVVEGS